MGWGMKGTDEVLVEVAGGVGRLTLHRPRALNALTQEMCETLLAVLRGELRIPMVLVTHALDEAVAQGRLASERLESFRRMEGAWLERPAGG